VALSAIISKIEGGGTMTKEQYEQFDNYQFLSDEDKDAVRERNFKNGYGLSDNQLRTLIRKHKKARKDEDYKAMALIEYRLTDINFHGDCGALCRGDYDEILGRLDCD
jgi:hypothetical protein